MLYVYELSLEIMSLMMLEIVSSEIVRGLLNVKEGKVLLDPMILLKGGYEM